MARSPDVDAGSDFPPSESASSRYDTERLFPREPAARRLDYDVSENMKFFVRLGYDNASQVGPTTNSFSTYRNQINVPSAAFGLDWNHGRFVQQRALWLQKMVNAVNADLGASLIDPSAPFFTFNSARIRWDHRLPVRRQTIQRDLFGRYDSITRVRVRSYLPLRGFHSPHQPGRLSVLPADYGPSVTSSNGLATIPAIDSNPGLLVSGRPRGAATIPSTIPWAPSPSSTASETSVRTRLRPA